jgi:hypothetical protein
MHTNFLSENLKEREHYEDQGIEGRIILEWILGKSTTIAQLVKRWAMGWTIGVLVFDSRRGLGIFLFTTASRTALGPTQPPIQ